MVFWRSTKVNCSRFHDRNLGYEKSTCSNLSEFIGTFASWQDALKPNKEPENIQSHELQIFETISESMMMIHKLSIMLEDLKLNSDDESVDTYERETPKVSRNDPCPCGSGKKYKKCCLH
jgi:uncharacterized protein YecA (UPF0149 family)